MYGMEIFRNSFCWVQSYQQAQLQKPYSTQTIFIPDQLDLAAICVLELQLKGPALWWEINHRFCRVSWPRHLVLHGTTVFCTKIDNKVCWLSPRDVQARRMNMGCLHGESRKHCVARYQGMSAGGALMWLHIETELHWDDAPLFWCSVTDEYPELLIHAIKVTLPFTPTYRCKSGFSSMAQLKRK